MPRLNLTPSGSSWNKKVRKSSARADQLKMSCCFTLPQAYPSKFVRTIQPDSLRECLDPKRSSGKHNLRWLVDAVVDGIPKYAKRCAWAVICSLIFLLSYCVASSSRPPADDCSGERRNASGGARSGT